MKLSANRSNNYWNNGGYEVVAVEDFMDVLRIFVESDPHLILMDIGLPLYNGYHWCQEIRKVSKVPIMFLSSRDQAMDIVMAINMGGDDFVTKPFDQNVLPCQGPRTLAPLLRIWDDQNLLEHRELSSILSPRTWCMKGKSSS